MPKNTEPKHTSKPQDLASDEAKAWLDMVPIGREFGSPDYDRLTALDQAAFAAFKSWEQVREWLATPHTQLDGVCPEDAARNPDGFGKVMSILMLACGHAGDDSINPDGFGKVMSILMLACGHAGDDSIEDMNAANARRGAKKK